MQHPLTYAPSMPLVHPPHSLISPISQVILSSILQICHIQCFLLKLLIEQPTNPQTGLPNGEKAFVTHIGIVQVSNTLTLYGVLCVPSFSFNMISVTQFTRVTLCCLIFLGSFCFIQDLVHWNTISLGRESRGLLSTATKSICFFYLFSFRCF